MDIEETHRPINAKKAKLLSNPAYRGTEAKFRVLLAHYAKHGRLLRACEAAGIDHSSHYRRLQSDAGYRAAVEEAEQQVAQHLEDGVYKMAADGELQAAVVLLRRFRPQHYRERASLDVTATVNLADLLTEARNRVLTLKRNDRNGTEG